MKNKGNIRIISERFCSKYLNDRKLSLLKIIDEDNIKIKNQMSDIIFENRELLLSSSKYDLIKKFAASFKSQYLKAWNIQAMFADVVIAYMNYIEKLKSNLQLKVIYKPATISYYKKSIKWHKVGDVKEIEYNKRWTSFTKLLKALVFIDNVECLKPEIKRQYDFYVEKFTKRRIDNLVKLIKQNLLKKIHKIEFKTGTWRCNIQTKADFVIDETNSLYKHWMKISLRKEYGDIYIPLQINSKYHDLSKSNKSSWLVKCIKDKVLVIGTKEAKALKFYDEVNVEGLDLNVKHNFCAISDGKIFDYDRTYVKQLYKELKKLDKIGLKNINDNQRKHLDKICRRNEWYFKKLISEVLDYCISKEIYDIVLEDLELFNGSYAKNIEFGIKYSRLVRLLRLNSVKEWMKQQAEKKGIRIHLTLSYYSSQQCPVCGHIDGENRKTQEEFECCNCGHHANADLNAAKNLKRRFTNVLWKNSLHAIDTYSRLIPKSFIKKDFVKSILSNNETSLYCDVNQ